MVRVLPSVRSPLAPLTFLALLGLAACGGTDAGSSATSPAPQGNALATLWVQGETAFGVFVPDERPRPAERPAPGTPRLPALYTSEGALDLARNPLYDYLFLNLEGGYDPEAVRTLVAALQSPEASGTKPLLVRIPTIERDGEELTRERVREVLAMGADGIVMPHIRSIEEARLAISFFQEAGADIWSPRNPGGKTIVMLMVEDPDAVAQAGEIADLDGISVLACGIGSYTASLGGDREAAERGNLGVLAESTRAGLGNMITADVGSVERRIAEGFPALLMSGAQADSAIVIGRAIAGR
jgi:hypothetical protein